MAIQHKSFQFTADPLVAGEPPIQIGFSFDLDILTGRPFNLVTNNLSTYQLSGWNNKNGKIEFNDKTNWWNITWQISDDVIFVYQPGKCDFEFFNAPVDPEAYCPGFFGLVGAAIPEGAMFEEHEDDTFLGFPDSLSALWFDEVEVDGGLIEKTIANHLRYFQFKPLREVIEDTWDSQDEDEYDSFHDFVLSFMNEHDMTMNDLATHGVYPNNETNRFESQAEDDDDEDEDPQM